MKPEISRKLKNLVSRVMNDAFSELPADELLKNLNRFIDITMHFCNRPNPSLLQL